MAKNLTAFLAQNAKKIDNVTFIASDRFIDPDTGEAMPWEICCITAAENAGLRKACMRTVPVPGRKGQFTQDFDANAYLAKVAVRCTVFPNLNDAELQQSYGVMGAEQLITTMLTPPSSRTTPLRSCRSMASSPATKWWKKQKTNTRRRPGGELRLLLSP